MKNLIEALSDFSEYQKEAEAQYKQECDEYWASLSEEDKLKAFYSVISRVVQGELKDRGSYRHVLYEVFGFGPESYGIGMQCGFLSLHNSICTDEELTKLREMHYNEAGYSLKETITVDLHKNEKDDGSLYHC
jgi:hypothetical protein